MRVKRSVMSSLHVGSGSHELHASAYPDLGIRAGAGYGTGLGKPKCTPQFGRSRSQTNAKHGRKGLAPWTLLLARNVRSHALPRALLDGELVLARKRPQLQMSDWALKFSGPVRLRDGRSIATLSQARDLISSLSEAQQERPFWVYTARLLMAAAEGSESSILAYAEDQLHRAVTDENMQYRSAD